MSKYISGHKVIEELNIEGFELVGLVQKGSLQPFNKSNGKKICDSEIKRNYQDNEKLRLLNLELGSFQTGIVLTGNGYNIGPRREINKAEIERKFLEEKSKPPLPNEYQNCVYWESFAIPENEGDAHEVVERFKGYLYLKEEVEGLKQDYQVPDNASSVIQECAYLRNDPTPNTNKLGNQKESLHVDAVSPLTENEIKKIQVRPENDGQFQIKFPGKSFRPCTYADLNYTRSDTKEFRALLEVIKFGSIYLPNRAQQQPLERACKRLLKFIEKEYNFLLPEDFKLWGKESKNYFLIFDRTEDAQFDPRNNLSKLSKDQLVQGLKDLVKGADSPPDEVKTESDFKNWKDRQYKKITDTFYAAQKKGATEQELNEIVFALKNKEWDEDQRGDDNLDPSELENGFSVKYTP